MRHTGIIIVLDNFKNDLQLFNSIVNFKIFCKYKNLKLYITTLDESKDYLTELFSYNFNFISLSGLANKNYIYNPNVNQIDILHKIDEIDENTDYLVIQNVYHDFKCNTMSDLDYINTRHIITKDILSTIHEYLLIQLNSVVDIEKKYVYLFLNDMNADNVIKYVIRNKHCKYLLFTEFKNEKNNIQLKNNLKAHKIPHHFMNDVVKNDLIKLLIINITADLIIGELNILTYNSLFRNMCMMISTNIKYTTDNNGNDYLIQPMNLHNFEHDILFLNIHKLLIYI